LEVGFGAVPSANLGAKKEREKGESSQEHPFNYYARNIIDNMPNIII